MLPLTSLLLLVPQLLGSRPATAPLPEEVQSAKTIFIANRTGFQNPADAAYDELQKWGRFKIVTDRAKADITVVLNPSHDIGAGSGVPSFGPAINVYTAEYVLKGQQDPFLVVKETTRRFEKDPTRRCIDDLQKRMEGKS